MATIQKMVPCLWFDSQADEAARLYVSVFERSRIGQIARFPAAGQEVHGRPAGSVMTVAFELDGVSFTALNGGPLFKFNESVSLQVMCETQDEIDRFWTKLGEGGDEKAQQCGWLKDRFGVSWQVVPAALGRILGDPDPDRARRATEAMMAMKKLDIAQLERAADGVGAVAG